MGDGSWTPAEYQAWWRMTLAGYLPWVKVAVAALVVDAILSAVMLAIWIAERWRK